MQSNLCISTICPKTVYPIIKTLVVEGAGKFFKSFLIGKSKGANNNNFTITTGFVAPWETCVIPTSLLHVPTMVK